MAAFGGQSTCKHCGKSFRATPMAKKVVASIAIGGLIAARIFEKLLASVVRPETAFVVVIVGLIALSVAITELMPVQENGSNETDS